MTSRLRLWVAICAGLAVFLVGTIYVIQRDERWHSSAALTLTPQTADAADRATLLDSFFDSGTIGTYVELISSPDTLAKAGSPDVSVEVRAVPDTRVIDVTVTGSQNDVRTSLRDLIDAARSLEPSLGDIWALSVIQQPSEATKSGPSDLLLVLAILLLAPLAGVAAWVLARELVPAREGEPEPQENHGKSPGGRNRKWRDGVRVGSESGDGAAGP